jgi:hypothetical protein
MGLMKPINKGVSEVPPMPLPLTLPTLNSFMGTRQTSARYEIPDNTLRVDTLVSSYVALKESTGTDNFKLLI